jgi:hypothetical protein
MSYKVKNGRVASRKKKPQEFKVALSWQDAGHWQGTDDGKTTFSISRDGLLAGELFAKYDQPGQLVVEDGQLEEVYNDGDLQRLDKEQQRTGWMIMTIPADIVAKAKKEYAARKFFDECAIPVDPKVFGEKEDDIFPANANDDMFFAIDRALENPDINMVFVEASDSGDWFPLRNPEHKPTKSIAKIVCAEDDQLLLVRDKYASFIIDSLETVYARISPN